MSRTIKSTMGLSRQFLNLIVANHEPGVKSLCCMHLEHLFGSPTTPPQTSQTRSAVADLTMERIQLGPPRFSFRATSAPGGDQRKIDCFPLVDSTMICVDQLGRALCFDAQMRLAGVVPRLHKPKCMPISLFVPKPDVDKDFSCLDGGSSLLVMERIPKPEVGCSTQYSDQFEAYVFGRTTTTSWVKSWQRQLLPPPPYIRDPKFCHSHPEISSHMVLEGGSQVCISVKGVGTYLLDTVNYIWSQVGKWTLPFQGKVEYVPELKLWFGLSAEAGHHLAAADLSTLSTLDSQPPLVGVWKELVPPEEWKESKDSQLINLGSGMFCIARFFQSRTCNGYNGDELFDPNFAVFTGVKLETHPVLDANGNSDSSGKTNVGWTNTTAKIQMIPYKSRCHMSNDTAIDAVF